jgi:hypothetical protein
MCTRARCEFRFSHLWHDFSPFFLRCQLRAHYCIMAYQPKNVRPLQPAHLDNIELETRYDPAAYSYAPPAGHPPSQSDSKIDDDNKPFFRSGLNTSQQRPIIKWPVTAQRAAALTPLRAGLMVFDAVLASTPIMFIGEFTQSYAVDDIFDAFLWPLVVYLRSVNVTS